MKRKTALVLLSIQMSIFSAFPAWAQRRVDEPEANPQFSQQDQNSQGQANSQNAQEQANSMEGSPLGAATTQSSADSSYSEAPPASVQIGQQSAAAQEAPAKATSPLDKTVSIRLNGAPLSVFLQTISAQSDINFIITEGLESHTVTVFLQNVTVREALEVLLELKGLTYQQVGHSNTYIVMQRSKSVPNLVTHIYTLSYIPLIPIDSLQAEQASITPTGSSSGGGASQSGQGGGSSAQGSQGGNASTTSSGCSGGSLTGGSGAGGAGGSRGSGSGASGQGSQIAIVNVVCSVLSTAGHVMVEPRTNSLIVTDVPEVFPQVEQIITALDKKTDQVMIEAQIVEIDSDRENDLGISWGGANGELASFTGGERDTSFPMVLPSNLSAVRFLDPVSNIISSLGTASNGATTSGSSGSSAAGAFLGSNVMTSVLNLTSLQVILRALVSRSEARFLGKPKILTLNNKPAIIQAVEDQATDLITTTNLTSGSNGNVATSQPERFETGLTLRVTPQINKEGYITMFIQPVFTNAQVSPLSSATQAIYDPVTRSASTLVRVKNGQTLVLGGLLQSTENKAVQKVPFLGYIPLIGWLFTSTSSSRINSDLVIFITPTIVSD